MISINTHFIFVYSSLQVFIRYKNIQLELLDILYAHWIKTQFLPSRSVYFTNGILTSAYCTRILSTRYMHYIHAY